MQVDHLSHNDAQALAVRRFWIHLGVYVAVNAGLVMINLKNNPDQHWFIWPMLGWGAGVAAHAVGVFVTGRTAERLQSRSERNMERRSRKRSNT